MLLEPSKRQLAAEANRLLSLERALPRSAEPVENYHIESYLEEAYRPKSYLRKMMTPALYDELSSILAALRALNEDYVGEPIVEVKVYFALTAIHKPLRDRMLLWTKALLDVRTQKYNPHDQDNECRKFRRLFLEYWEIFRGRERSVDYLCYSTCECYAASLIFERTVGKLVVFDDSVEDRISAGISGNVDRDELEHLVRIFQFGRDDLGCLLRRITTSECSATLQERSSETPEQLRRDIMLMAEDICHMRPFLARNSRPEKTLMSPFPGLVLAFQRCANEGVGMLCAGDNERVLLERLHVGQGGRHLLLALDGSLLDGRRPWIRMEDVQAHGSVSNLAINAWLVEVVWERRFGFYDQIDQTKFGRKPEDAVRAAVDEDEELEWSCQELAAEEPEDDETPRGRPRPAHRLIRHLRLPKFLHTLQTKLGCEVRSGKGDETTIFRLGGKIFCIGRPPRVYSVIVKRALRQLNISVDEWLTAVGVRGG